jgi:hypothetical protein
MYFRNQFIAIGIIFCTLLIGFGESRLSEAALEAGSEFEIGTSALAPTNTHPSIAGLSNGGFAVTWDSGNISHGGLDVLCRIFDSSGNNMGDVFQVNTFNELSQANPSAAGLSGGGFVVVWESSGQSGAGTDIYSQIFNNSGTKLGTEFQVNTYTNGNQLDPSVAGLAGGDFVVTWESENGIYGQIFDSAGNKVGTELIIDFPVGIIRKEFPSVDGFAGGGFVVSWVGREISGQLFDNVGNKIGEEFQVNTSTMGEDPSVSTLSTDGFVVTWTSEAGWDDIYGQLFDNAGNKVGEEFRVNTYTYQIQQSPSVAGLAGGGFVVTWESYLQDGSSYGIYGQLFDSTGNMIDNEFQINSKISGGQDNPSVIGLSSRKFVVSFRDTGTIKGKIFIEVDNTPPTIISTNPVNNKSDVAINMEITCTFSEAIDSSTITNNTFFLNDGLSNVDGTVKYSANTATFKPTSPLDYSKTYTATITTGVKDLAGNPLQTDYIWSFNTLGKAMPWIPLLLLDSDERLTTSQWAQDGYYRYYYDTDWSPCLAPPDITSGQPYVVGCTAVAIGQIINYYFQKGYRKGWLEVLLQNVKVYPRFGFTGIFFDKDCTHVGLVTNGNYADHINEWQGPNNAAYLLREFLWTVALGLDSYFSGDDDGTSVSEDFSYLRGFITYQEKIKTLLRDRFRFNPNITYTGELTRLDAERDYIINSINRKEPVLVFMSCDARGHVVLIDQYIITSNGQFAVKINFGWGNKSNENNYWYPTNGAFSVGCLWKKFIIFKNTTPINY